MLQGLKDTSIKILKCIACFIIYLTLPYIIPLFASLYLPLAFFFFIVIIALFLNLTITQKCQSGWDTNDGYYDCFDYY